MAPKIKQHRDDLLKDESAQKAAPIPMTSGGIADQDDKLGKMSLTTSAATTATEQTEAEQLSKPTPLHDAVQRIAMGFIWVSEAAQRHLVDLKASLAKADKLTWQERLAETALDVALAAGAAACGEFIAVAAVAGGQEVAKEFVKSLFEQGIDAGVGAGRAQLKGGESNDALDSFFAVQESGVAAMYQENQDNFFDKGQHKIRNLEEAVALRDAFSYANAEKGGKKQADATRDAWVSYLAQSKFGSKTENTGSGAVATTNMATQEERDWNRSHPSWGVAEMTTDAPDINKAALGRAQGLLAVSARLPDIADGKMQGRPEVTVAFLNGLNEENRNEYLGYLSNAHVPRQVKAKVDGQFENFSLNIDEAGKTEQAAMNPWLNARGKIENTSPTYNDRDIEQRGLDLLLAELNVTELRDKMPGV